MQRTRTRPRHVTRANASFAVSANSCTRSSQRCVPAWSCQMPDDSSSPANPIEQAKRLQLAETLLHVSRSVSTMETLDEVLAALVEMTVRATDSDRGTLFLNDPATGELYSRVLQGERMLEIRFLNDVGIAGRVFTTHESLIINDAYA